MNRKRVTPPDNLTRRERQIMDVIYAVGSATANEIEERLPDAPTHATVRTILRILLQKGHLQHHQAGRAFIYEPTRPADAAAKNALRRMIDVFFAGSIEKAVSGLLGVNDSPPSPEELDRLEELIRSARQSSSVKKSTRK